MTKMLHVINREKALSLGMIRYYTGKICRNGHNEERLVSNRLCLGCARDANKKHYKRALKEQRNTEDGRERRIMNDRRYLEKNREQIQSRQRARYAAKKELMRKQKKEWAAANKASVLATQRRIKFMRMRRAPSWLTQDDWLAMERLYEQCRSKTAESGIVHHVDHIVPLVGKTVSGLHVPWNLRIIPAKENLSKGNRFEV